MTLRKNTIKTISFWLDSSEVLVYHCGKRFFGSVYNKRSNEILGGHLFRKIYES